jgi:hypothetical protein
MTWRRLPLPVVFVGSLILSAAAIVSFEAVHVGPTVVSRMRADPITIVYFAMASIVFAALTVFIIGILREYRRAQRPEMSDYRHALKTGQIFGDVSYWPEWIRHDRRVTVWWVGGALWFFFWGGVEAISGRWEYLWMFVMGAFAGWKFWDTRRRLMALEENVTSR